MQTRRQTTIHRLRKVEKEGKDKDIREVNDSVDRATDRIVDVNTNRDGQKPVLKNMPFKVKDR